MNASTPLVSFINCPHHIRRDWPLLRCLVPAYAALYLSGRLSPDNHSPMLFTRAHPLVVMPTATCYDAKVPSRKQTTSVLLCCLFRPLGLLVLVNSFPSLRRSSSSLVRSTLVVGRKWKRGSGWRMGAGSIHRNLRSHSLRQGSPHPL